MTMKCKINIRSICLVNSPIRLSGPMEPRSLEELRDYFPHLLKKVEINYEERT